MDQSLISYDLFMQRLHAVRSRIAAVCQEVQRPVEGVSLLPVTKGCPPVYLEYCLRAGLAHVGESRIQEALLKQEAYPGLHIELLGPVQRNKEKKALALACRIQTLGSLAQAQRWESYAQPIRVLIQVNVDADPAKHGLLPDQADPVLHYLSQTKYLRAEGLMTILRRGHTPLSAAAAYQALAGWARVWQDRFGLPLLTLSMGMSADYAVAVAAGSTLVRLGEALFGPAKEGGV